MQFEVVAVNQRIWNGHYRERMQQSDLDQEIASLRLQSQSSNQ
jgi:hypothetical protein